MKSTPLNLYVVDDNEAVRKSLGMLLLSRGYAVRLFDSGEAFLAAANQDIDGCVILDLRLEGMSGLEVQEALKASRCSLVVLFLSGHGDIPAAIKAVQNGAFGWLQKPCSDEVLIQKVEQALVCASSISEQKMETQKAEKLWQKLTPREKEVARLTSDGKSCKAIARELISVETRTIEKHRANVYAKLGFNNSNELDRFLRQYNL